MTTPYKTYNMVLEYAKLFDTPNEFGDLDRGNPTSDKKWLRELSKNPEGKVNCYFTSEEDLQDLMDSPNFENEVVNPQNGAKSYRVKEGTLELGIGKYITVKRKLDDVREFIDTKTKELKTVDYGGLVEVVALVTDEETGEQAFEPFDPKESGAISNGSEAKVKFHPKYLRLEKVGITNLIEYVPSEDEDGF